MAKILAMFPGQGSQYAGMGRQLLEQFPYVKDTFEEAEDAASLQIRRLCLDGPEADLRLTANTQPCILTVSAAIWRVLRRESGLAPTAFAGHSLGEYSALVAAGRLDLARAVYLVRRRGEAMQKAVPEGVGAMAAVINCPANDLTQRCRELSRPDRLVEVVNFNSPQQLVVAGHKEAVDQLGQQLADEGIRFVSLPVSAPFHSSLMKPAREEMSPLLLDTVFESNESHIIANLTGKVERDYDARFLIEQINHPVLWTQSLESAGSLGCSTYLEVGPGKVLFGLARRGLPRGNVLIHTEDLPKAIEQISL